MTLTSKLNHWTIDGSHQSPISQGSDILKLISIPPSVLVRLSGVNRALVCDSLTWLALVCGTNNKWRIKSVTTSNPDLSRKLGNPRLPSRFVRFFYCENLVSRASLYIRLRVFEAKGTLLGSQLKGSQKDNHQF